MATAQVRVYESEVRNLAHSAGLRADMRRRAAAGASMARRLCPVRETPGEFPGGRLQRSILSRVGEDERGLFAEVYIDPSSPAAEYWQFVEFPTRPHSIDSHGDYPLRNKYADPPQVFGPHVDHPGTQAQPFLRPSLAAMLR